MKIFSAAQLREWDDFTIKNEPVPSIDLMERAAKACTEWIIKNCNNSSSFKIFCGKGNNGGDGLAVGRILIKNNIKTTFYIAETGSAGSGDFNINLERLKELSAEIHFLESDVSFPEIKKEEYIIDALFGTGLNKKPSGIYKKLILHLNNSGAKIISIDVPSGLFTDKNSKANPVIQAFYTLSFQQLKLSFLLPENEPYFGKIVVLEIGLSRLFYSNENAAFELIDKNLIEKIYLPRKPFANKGDYGYACMIVGSYGMMGAAVISAKACLRSGVGKLTCFICKEGYEIMQTAVPEAMCKTYGNSFIKDIESVKNFDVVGIGPGIGRHLSHKQLLQKVFKNSSAAIVIDADALNVLSSYPAIYKSIPPQSIITPHPKEFERMFGKSDNDFERVNLALKKAKELNIFIVLKGHRTLIATPYGKGYFNVTGNPGMATAGSGDALTGILTGLLGQKYAPLSACLLGVYLHGLAGDIAADKFSEEAMIADDIINNLGEGFKQIAVC